MARKKKKAFKRHFIEKSRDETFILIWKSVVIGLIAGISGIVVTVIFHFLKTSEHQLLVLIRYFILTAAIGYGIFHLTKFSPKIESQNLAILSGLLIAITKALTEISSNFLLPVIDDSMIIMDKIFLASGHLQYAIIGLELLVNSLVLGFIISTIYCMTFFEGK